jgi:Rrf2 family protein
MLSATAEHAVRALIQLAVLGGSGSVTGKQLSCTAGIPQNYLSKILCLLGHAGMIHATRGSHGGYQLVWDASQIRLTDVVNLFDHARWRKGCFLDCGRDCKESEQCAAHSGWQECREVFERFLDRTTIAALAAPVPVPPLVTPQWKGRRAS